MERRALLPFEHPLDRSLPAVRSGRGGDLGEDRVADPGLGRHALDGENLREPLGARDAHLVVFGIVEDERAALDRLQAQRRACEARPQVGRERDGGVAVAEHGEQAP